jgi:hypothetical protein
MFNIKRAADLLGISPFEVFLKLLELEELGLISMKSVGEDRIRITIYPLERLTEPGRDVANVIQGYQL